MIDAPLTPIIQANSYDDCIRRCDPCGVGYSNAQSNPTLIYRDPCDNVPEPVRAGFRETLERALNERNRPNKIRKAGFSTSEDAVTWTVLKSLYDTDQLAVTLSKLALISESDAQVKPKLLFWGVPISPEADDEFIRLRTASDDLGEKQHSRTEPDVLISFPHSLIIIEVKYRSKNEIIDQFDNRFDTYLNVPEYFSDETVVRQSCCYELVRNWNIGYRIADTKEFHLINLIPSSLLNDQKQAQAVSKFSVGIKQGDNRHFTHVTWSNLIGCLHHPIEEWLQDYITCHNLR
jgi:hypothetical protein